ncbi:MAG: MFS transporter [Methanomassiliicoccales archaeon]|jgi:MFS family permease
MARFSFGFRGYDRRIWVLFTSMLIDGVGFSIISPYMMLFLKQELDVSLAIGGLVLMVAGIVGAIGNVVGGLMADKYGRRGVMITSMLLRCGTFILLSIQVTFFPELISICLMLSLSYFFGGVFGPANNAMVADLTEPSKRMEAYGLLRVAWNLGFAVGPIIGGALILVSFSLTFTVSAVISFGAALIVALMITESYVPKPKDPTEKKAGLWKDIAHIKPIFLLFCIVCIPMYIMSGQFGSTYTVFANERIGIDTATIGLVFALNGIMVVLMQMPISRFLTERNPYMGMAAGTVIYSLGFLLIAAVTDGFGLAITMVIITLGEMIVVPVSTSLTVFLSPDDERGRYLGIFGLISSFGWFGSSFIGGILYDSFDNGWAMWGILAFLGMITAVCLLPLWAQTSVRGRKAKS